jgi:hypothetical protein
MAGIDINSITGAIPNKQTAVQKLATLLIRKVTENENLIQAPLNNLLNQLPTDGTCLEPALLQSVLDKRNNIVDFLNKFGNFLDVTTSTYTGTNVAFNALLTTIRGINLSRVATSTASKAIPFGLPGAIPALLSDLGDLSDKLTFDSLGESKLSKIKNGLDTLNVSLAIVSSFVKNIIQILNSLDALLLPCLNENQKSQLTPVNEGLVKISTDSGQSIDNSTYQGFVFQIEEVPFSSTVNRIKAVAFNQSGIALLETPLSFTTNSQTLIDELKLIIDRDNLKAY